MEGRRSTSSWVDSLEKDLQHLPDWALDFSIFRVPKNICQINERAYTPKVVSIGPLHHGRQELQAMEQYKKRYLKDFLREHEVTLTGLIKFLQEREVRVRNSYAEIIHMNSDEFVKMLLLDSVFIIGILTRNYTTHGQTKGGSNSRQQRVINDYVWTDFLLVENQLPFFILEDILNMLKTKSSETINLSASLLAYTFLEMKMAEHEILLPEFGNTESKHFVDLLKNIHSAPYWENPTLESRLWLKNIPSATELQKAGIKFMKSPSTNLFDINFNFNNGVLEIPCLRLGSHSELLYGNLIVFEHYHYDEKLINDYFFLMDQLINTAKDVDLLIKNGIIKYFGLGSSEEVANIINNLGKPVIPQPTFYFSSICYALLMYYNTTRAVLRRRNTLWSRVSVAGTIILLLTLIQTVVTIIK